MTDPHDDTFPHSGDEFDPVDDFRMPLLEHLRELRRRFMIAVGSVLVGIALTFWQVDIVWDFLLEPMENALGHNGTMAITEPLEGFMTYLKVAAITGVTHSETSSPVRRPQISPSPMTPRSASSTAPLRRLPPTLSSCGGHEEGEPRKHSHLQRWVCGGPGRGTHRPRWPRSLPGVQGMERSGEPGQRR